MKNFSGTFRALRRAAFGLAMVPVIATAAVVQGLVLAPLFDKRLLVATLLEKTLRHMYGMKTVFNEASAPLVKKNAWYVANHISGTDLLPVSEKLKGMPIGRDDISKNWFVRQGFKVFNFIRVQRTAEYNKYNRGRIIDSLNKGRNVIMFPEGVVNQGGDLKLFHAGLFTILYGQHGINERHWPVTLEKDVVVQPVAIRMKEIEGRDVLGSEEEIRRNYAIAGEQNPLKRVWRRMHIKNVTMELTVLPALKAADFKDAKELINHAAQDIAGVVRPGQKAFVKGRIIRPGSSPKKTL